MCGQEWPVLQFCLLPLTTKKGDCKCETCVHQVIGGVVCLTFHFFEPMHPSYCIV